MGVMIEAGIVKEGTPICVVKKKDDKTEVGLEKKKFTHFLKATKIFYDERVCMMM